MSGARLLGSFATVVALSLMAASTALMVASFGVGDAVYAAVAGLVSLPALGLGWLILRQVPDNLVGSLLCLLGLLPNTLAFASAYSSVVERRPGLLPVSDLLVTLGPGDWMWLYVPPALLLLYFPTGRLLSRRWRAVVAALLAVPVAFEVLAAVVPDPFPVPFSNRRHVFGIATGDTLVAVRVAAVALILVWMGLLIASAVSLVLRYRRSDRPVERAQLRWFAVAALSVPAALAFCWLSYLITQQAALVMLGFAIVWIAVPTVTAIAILRHDLYDVNLLASAAVTYLAITAALIVVYGLASMGAAWLVHEPSPLLAAAVTAICAVGFSPVRRRLQRIVDRRLYPSRQRALSAVEDLLARTHAGTARPEELEEVLRRSLDEPELRVGYRLPGQQRLVGVDGQPVFGPTVDPAAPEPAATPVSLGGQQIGALLGGTRTSPPLLKQVGHAAALVVEMARLRLEVATALTEAETSRRRLQTAEYVERQRLERDLHDGAQQRLVSLGLALRLAQRHLTESRADLHGLLDHTVAEIGTAVAELRQLGHGLRPSCLDDGLGPALATLTTAAPVPITIDVRADDLPDDIATTAYFVVAEAVANAVKHADPQQIGVSVQQAQSMLTVQVRDDGCGGADPRGSGLSGMADRVAAAGGRVTVRSPRHLGTTVEAVLPCAS
jgi:signal transduction histidine kinase